MIKFLGIKPSLRKHKKYDAFFLIGDRIPKTVSFGAAGMEDYTTHRDLRRQERYVRRHRAHEDWNNPMTAGALSRFILWSSPTLKEGIKNYRRHFRL